MAHVGPFTYRESLSRYKKGRIKTLQGFDGKNINNPINSARKFFFQNLWTKQKNKTGTNNKPKIRQFWTNRIELYPAVGKIFKNYCKIKPCPVSGTCLCSHCNQRSRSFWCRGESILQITKELIYLKNSLFSIDHFSSCYCIIQFICRT